MDVQISPRPAWQARAACRGVGPAHFYPEKGVQPDETAAARNVCRSCPVAGECEEAGKRERHGMWGGQTVDERLGRKVVAA